MKLKVLALVILAVLLIFTLNVMAVGSVKIDVGDEFFTFSANADEVCKIVGQSKEELRNYCTLEGILFLAVNEKNTKQIKVSCKKTTFSESVGNISLLSETEIEEIATVLVKNLSDVSIEIKDKNSQKFIRTQQTLKDSGGEYIQVNYITVADESIYTLSFYTSGEESVDYVSSVFASFDCDEFLNYNGSHKTTGVAATIIISLIGLWILYTLVRDIRNDKLPKENIATIEEKE